MRAVLEIALRHAFRQPARRRRNVPHQPVELVFARLVARAFHVVHVQHEALRRGGRIGPRHLRRHLLAGLRELRRDGAAVDERVRHQPHRRCARPVRPGPGASAALPAASLRRNCYRQRRGQHHRQNRC